MSTPSHTTDPGATSRRLEAAGLLLVLVALVLYLANAKSLIAFSDPANWFSFARHFTERFGESRLAYGFPLVAAAAIRLVGVFNGFLVNVPILVALTVLVYLLTRAQVPRRLARPAWVAPFGAAVALLLLLHFDGGILADLANPYRDPLSHALVLLSCWLVIRFREDPTHSLLRVAAAGLVFAYACSTRETAVLMLLPLFVYATASRLEQPDLPYLKPLLVFGGAFSLGSIPLLVQNLLISGNPLVPAQALKAFERSASLVPGVRASHFFETFPLVLEHLGSNLGVVGLALLAVGIVAAIMTRQGGILYLLLPAGAVYTLFYGSYYRAVERYLFVVDLYALPVAGVGAATLLHLLLRPIRTAGVRRGLAAAAVAIAFLGAAYTIIQDAFPAHDRFRLAGARKLQGDLDRLLPDDARVIGDAPLGRILTCFLDHEASELRFFRRNLTLIPNLRERVRAMGDRPEPLYAIFRGPAFQRFLLSEFDLVPLATLESARYGLQSLLKRDAFYVEEVRPWSRLESFTSVRTRVPGEHLLVLEVGALSRLPRSFARVRWGEQILDEHPIDGRNYYRVFVDSSRGLEIVTLASDQPVPRVIRAQLLPLHEALRLGFDANEMLELGGRFSESFRHDEKPYPTIDAEGFIDVPTAGGRNAFFLFVANLELRGSDDGAKRKLSIRVRDKLVPQTKLEQSAGGNDRSATRVMFWAGPPLAGDHNTRVHWELDPALDGDSASLSIHSLHIYRHEIAKRLSVDLGSSRADLFVVDGFLPRNKKAGTQGPSYRWTGPHARMRLFTWPGRNPMRLSVSYLREARLPRVPSPRPRIHFNGHRLRGSSRREPSGRYERVTLGFDVPAAWVKRGMNRLEILSHGWVPAGSGKGGEKRPRGIMLDSVTLERASAS